MCFVGVTVFLTTHCHFLNFVGVGLCPVFVFFKIPNMFCTVGVGKVYVEFKRLKTAKKAHENLNTRTFAERKVNVLYYEELKYKANIF